MEPTAVLLSHDPSSLGMRGYRSEIISCNIRVLKDDGTYGTLQVVQVERFLTQLGFAEHVVQVACGTLVHLPTCMHKCVAKFPALFGWTADMVTGSTISQILQKHLPQGSFTEIQPRLHDKTLSATFRAHSDLIDTVLKISGQDRIFHKLHDSETVRPSLDPLWLPEETNIEAALTLCATSTDTYGIALKNASANHRLALRFLDIDKLQAFAKEHSIDDFSHLGRWKLSGVPSHSGPVGALAVLQDRSWDVHEIVYCNARHCIFVANSKGDCSPMYIEVGRHRRQLKIEAINAIARQQQAEAAQASRPSPSGCIKGCQDICKSVLEEISSRSSDSSTTRDHASTRPEDR